MQAHTVAYLASYILATGAMMYANTAWFGAGDVKFGSAGWQLYWPLWAAFYLPPVIAAVGMAWWSALPAGRKAGLLWASLPVVLAFMEVSFFLDIGLPMLLVEWVVLVLLFRAAGSISQAAELGVAPASSEHNR